jgi:(3R)-3-hydroxyacyl-CoA dehydrogenase / 3a,7a,12a-trihydroxy-5b-cholest-24-enoyl-CoA hydratase / enoyl-CoA hydratase 2
VPVDGLQKFTSIGDGVTPEFVRDRWDAVTDMNEATHLNSIGEASASFMGILEELKNPSASVGSKFEDSFTYSSRDLMLYALGIGVSTDDEDNLRYLYENHPDFAAFPTFSVMPGIILSMTSGLVSSKLPNFDLSQVNTLEQSLKIRLTLSVTLLFSFRCYTVNNILNCFDPCRLMES